MTHAHPCALQADLKDQAEKLASEKKMFAAFVANKTAELSQRETAVVASEAAVAAEAATIAAQKAELEAQIRALPTPST